ncbi:hypothetical protein MP228_011313 [Amoeboaphelidium protococcarum]|nr:hypothetical protein MP228_011313 [Amoeboaphelidium protococcarum]
MPDAYRERKDGIVGLLAVLAGAAFVFRWFTAPEVIDLHDHTVQEARDKVTELLRTKPSGSSLRLIVGRGNHSLNGKARIKPAIQCLLKDHPRVGAENFEFDGNNDGAFNVNIL